MNKRWIWIIVGVIAFCVILFAGVVAGAGLTYFVLQASPAKAAREVIREVVNITTDDNEAGALVIHVESGSPAAEAGIQRGDIILAVDDQKVDTQLELMGQLEDKSAGDEVILTIQHCESTQDVKVTLEERNDHIYLGLQVGRQAVFSASPLERGSVIIPVNQPAFLITDVVSGSPADEAGITPGAILVAVDGEEFQAEDNLADIIHSYQPGDEITLGILQPDAEGQKQVSVTLGENPDDPDQAYLGINYSPAPTFQGFDFQGNGTPEFKIPGFEGQDIPLPDLPEFMPQWHDFLNLPEGVESAVVVRSVVADSPADQAGLKPGDVITAVNGESIPDPATFVDLVQSFEPGEEVTLTTYRSGESESLEIDIVLGENPDQEGQAYLGVTIGGSLKIQSEKPGQGFEAPFHFDFEFPWQGGEQFHQGEEA